jgi:hypothetical protein
MTTGRETASLDDKRLKILRPTVNLVVTVAVWAFGNVRFTFDLRCVLPGAILSVSRI